MVATKAPVSQANFNAVIGFIPLTIPVASIALNASPLPVGSMHFILDGVYRRVAASLYRLAPVAPSVMAKKEMLNRCISSRGLVSFSISLSSFHSSPLTFKMSANLKESTITCFD